MSRQEPRPHLLGHPVGFWLALLAIWAVCAVVTALWDRFPNSGDEFSYLFQAKLFASGRLSAPSEAEAIRTAFDVDHIVDDGTMRSKYPPGWPALLATGQLLGVPWIVAPLLCALGAFFLFDWVRSVSSEGAAWASLFFWGTSSFVILNAASYFSHTAALALMTSAVWTALGSKPRPLVAGLLVGGAFLCRPLDGLLAAIALSVATSDREKVVRLGIGFSVGVAAFLLYNWKQFGSPLTTGYDAYLPTFTRLYAAEGGPDLSFSHLAYAVTHVQWLGELLLWVSPLVLFAPIGILATKRSASWRCCVTLLGLSAAAIFFMKENAGDAYGPRYLFPCVLPLAYFSALGAQHAIENLTKRSVVWCLATAGAMSAAFGCSRVQSAQNLIEARNAIYDDVESEDLANAVVVIRKTLLGKAQWFARNDPDHEQDVLYVTITDKLQLALLQARFPERDFYVYDVRKKPNLQRLSSALGQ